MCRGRAVIEHIRHRIGCVCTHMHRCRMIRHDKHAEIHAGFFQRICHRADHLLINVLDRGDLIGNASLMSHLVRSFNMHIDEIIPAFCQRFHRRLAFSAVIRIQAAVGAFDCNIVHTGPHRDAFQKINRGDHGPSDAVLLLKGCKRRPCARAPEPGRVCRILSFRPPFYIDRVVLQYIIASDHHVPEHRIRRQIFPDSSGQDIVGRRQFHHPPVMPDQQMPVACSHVELMSLRIAGTLRLLPFCKFFLQNIQKDSRILRADLSGTVVQDDPVFITVFVFRQRHQITTEGDVVCSHFRPDAERLQRRPAGIIFFRVIADH